VNKLRIRLETGKDCIDFVNISNTIEEPVILEDGCGFRANGKSLLGVTYGKFEFEELWVISDCNSLTSKFNRFMV
jgi:hypothetical protein